jgi:succinyl-CoA synthetase beta subunit
VGHFGGLCQRQLACWRPDLFCITNSHADAPSVVKAQILAGGRGKGKYESDGKGGVRIMSS